MSKPVLLLADDEPLFGKTTASYLGGQGFDVHYVADGLQASEVLKHCEVDLVIADLDMPGNRQLELIHACRTTFPDIPFIVVTGRPSLPSAIEGIRLGVHDYFLKPLELEDLLHSIRRALPPKVNFVHSSLPFEEILGESQAVAELKAMAMKVAKSNASVLIRGESGTGKELLARGIHNYSQRSQGPFVTVDCTSIPEPLFESTLFGHTKGAFTGALSDRAGLIELADRGTLFLDEVGELPMAIQSKLLRVLQFGTFLPVGKVEHKTVDVRIVAATHRDLKAEVAAGNFRLDLYYRLAVLEIVSPPLRSRKEDIALLAQHYLAWIAARDQRQEFSISLEAIEAFKTYDWPGNIRELANTIERCACLTCRGVIGDQEVKAALQDTRWMDTTGDSLAYKDVLNQGERRALEVLLRRHRGNVSQAAKDANMTRQGLHKAMIRLGISADEFRA
jgi:DNA-binding NtrC family response regulator